MLQYLEQTVRLIALPTGYTSSQYNVKLGELFTVNSVNGCCLNVVNTAGEEFQINHERFAIIDSPEKTLEWLKMSLRAAGVDCTSITTWTAEHMVDNPKLCYKFQVYQPDDSGDPEMKNNIWIYPDEQKLIIECNQWGPTLVEKELRTAGFMSRNMLHYNVEAC